MNFQVGRVQISSTWSNDETCRHSVIRGVSIYGVQPPESKHAYEVRSDLGCERTIKKDILRRPGSSEAVNLPSGEMGT